MAQASEEYISGEEFQKRQTGNHETGKKVTVPVRNLGLVAAVVIVAIASFAGGVAYQKHHTKSTVVTAASGTSGQTGTPGSGGFSRRGGAIGQVTAVSASSITVDNQRTGSSTTYTITSTTTITDNGQTASLSDIQAGDTVLVTVASTGSTTATRILVNPSFGGGFGGQGSGGASTPTN